MNKQWVAEEQFEGDESCGIAIMEGREEIVRVRGIGVADFENAQLIAAAPELFTALQGLLADAVALGIDDSQFSGSAIEARAAIRKATA